MKQSAPVILASGSPRRQALLRELGIEFTVLLREIDEHYPSELKREAVAEYLANKKSTAYQKEIAEGNFVITADTIVCAGDLILNKPSGVEEAIAMLEQLSGRAHQVITAVCITGPGPDKTTIRNCFHVSTSVIFRKLSSEEIKFYVETYRPFDKAGGYGIQEWIGLVGMERMEGSYYNVVGLPVKELYEHLVALKIITGL